MGAEAHGPKGAKTDNSLEGEVAGASYDTSGKSWLGTDVSSSGSGQVLKGELNKSFDGKLSVDRDEHGKITDIDVLEASASAKGSVLSGEAQASYGAAKVKGEADILTAEAEASAKVKIMEDGKFAPQIAAEAKASGDIAKGSLDATIGTDDNNVYGTAEGEFGHAEASAGVGVGKVTYKDADGNVHTGYGAYAEAGAEAYLAKGSLGGGLTICGIKFGASVEFKAGGAGATAGGEVNTGGLKGGLGLGLGVGLGINFSVDWSGFKWPEFHLPWSDNKDKKEKDKKSNGSSGGGGGPAKIYVFPDQIRGEASTLRSVSKEIGTISAEVAHVRDNLHLKGVSAMLYKQRLSGIIGAMKDEKEKVTHLADAMEEISQTYTNTENTIVAR